MSVATSPAPVALDADQLAQFKEQGYLVLEGFIEPELNEQLKREVDTWVGGGPLHDPYAATPRPAPGADKPRLQLELPEHGMLISHPPLMARLEQLMGSGFAFHHLHTARHDAGSHGVHWHHDYEQTPQVNRTHVMVHVFYYLNGLDGTIGDLMVLPKSHREVFERGLFGTLFGTADLPGSVTIDR
nr:phytanoyl-CoA dioxygenase family protein [Planctomycetota bacterium]